MPRITQRVFTCTLSALLTAATAASAQTPTQTQPQATPATSNATPAASPQATAGAPQTPATPAPESKWAEWMNKPTLLGDWDGFRTKAGKEYGTTFGVSFTQFFSWVPTIVDTSNYEYGNKLDVKVNTDLSKWAWKGLSVAAHVEMRAGTAPNLAGGTLVPTNTALLLPKPDGTEIRLSNLTFTQQLNPHVTMSVGRLNTVDLYSIDKLYTGGSGIDRFMNLSYNEPPLDSRTIPPVVEGITFNILNNGEVVASAGLIESTDPGFFKNGATVLWNVRLPLKPMHLPGHYDLGGAFSSVVATSLDQSPWVFFPQLGVPATTEQGAWTLRFTVDQALMADKNDATRTMGVFGSIGLSDGNPSPFQPYLFVGFGGNGYMLGRPLDSFGFGYYRGGLSGDLVNTLSPVIRLRDERGGEIYYNFALAPWTGITADLQFVDPFAVGSKTRTFFSLRWKVAF